jgi:hypothetical protein
MDKNCGQKIQIQSICNKPKKAGSGEPILKLALHHFRLRKKLIHIENQYETFYTVRYEL